MTLYNNRTRGLLLPALLVALPAGDLNWMPLGHARRESAPPARSP